VLALSQYVSFDALARCLQRLKLFTLLGGRLIEVLGPSEVPADFAAAVDETLASSRRFAIGQELLTWRLLAALSDAGVVAMPLKGPFLSERLYGDAALRPSTDIDLLVAPRDLDRALGILEAAGCRLVRPGRSLPRLHHVLELPDGLTVELHWRIHWYERRYAGAMLERSSMVDGLRRPAPTDELLSLLLYAARDGFVGLRGLVDVSAFWARNQRSIDRAELRATVAEFPELERPTAAAALCVDSVLGTDIAFQLSPRTTGRWAVRAAVELCDWGALRSEGDADVRTKVVDGLLSAPDGVPRFLGRALFPRLPGSGWERVLRQGSYALYLVGKATPVYWDLVAGRRP
jgi:hypothetical protein